MQFSEQQLKEWREHPVTEAMLGLQRQVLEARGQAISSRYLAGMDPAQLEPERQLYQALRQVLEDFEEASAEDVEQWKEQLDEWQRDKTG